MPGLDRHIQNPNGPNLTAKVMSHSSWWQYNTKHSHCLHFTSHTEFSFNPSLPVKWVIKSVLQAGTRKICILDYPRMLHYLLKREPSWGVLHQKLH